MTLYLKSCGLSEDGGWLDCPRCVLPPPPPPNDGNHINDGPSHIIIDTSFKELAPTPHECRLLYAVQYSTGTNSYYTEYSTVQCKH